ncbi:arylamine N-acetyltransferase [Paenibacillus sp. J5C_2022]|uniref:arylamine N-acetyltransferase family protein n=1 Tax=Paenibacillus sp. J5C2022 TaxID=2977129 RepID=UPI0021CE2E7E|nr:arylamine N-acetyltransferase [Paenibacillus sp. J5C2022]MCU6711299.1 arylamine N-acetyltransferase [Paenibacillus sp. J5C2022]
MNQTETVKQDVRAYLKRIGHEEASRANAALLSELQNSHLHTVPYENLDILNRKPLSLEIPDLLDKIVYRQRGGYCFELNALFGWLLRQLGYTVHDRVARFWRQEQNMPPKRRHQVLKVEAEGEFYLVDVGVGGIVPRRPIRMVEGLEQVQGDECYKLERDDEFGWLLCELKHGSWERIYSFTEEPQYEKDFIMPSFWCEHAEDSVFRQGAMLAVRTSTGRNTVAGEEFRIFDDKGVHAFVPETEDEYKEALRTYFNIQLT